MHNRPGLWWSSVGGRGVCCACCGSCSSGGGSRWGGLWPRGILNITIIGLPIGLAMLNRVPQVMTLSPGTGQVVVYELGGITRISRGAEQLPFLLRVVYFVLVGWWLSLIWTVAGYAMMVIPFTWPIGFAMFNVIGFITTLRRN
jgi:uncharacterized membrane protein YccF (DUF307 family)